MLAAEGKAQAGRETILAYGLDAATGDWGFVQELDPPGGANATVWQIEVEGNNAIVHRSDGVLTALAVDPMTGLWQVLGALPTTLGGSELHHGDLAMHGEVLLVGVPMADQVEVYERAAGAPGWMQVDTLPAPGTNSSRFGNALAFDGRTAVIGDQGNGTTTGSAYAWTRQVNGDWDLQGVLRIPGPEYVGIGSSVAVQDDLIVVGADRTPGAGSSQGALITYRFVPSINSFALSGAVPVGAFGVEASIGREISFDDGYLVVRARPVDPSQVSELRVVPFNRIKGLFAMERTILAQKPASASIRALTDSFSVQGGRLVYANQLTGTIDSQPISNLDCDQNGIGDTCEILSGALADTNGNWRHDACEETGSRYCSPAAVNSTGRPSTIGYFGRPGIVLLSTEICVSDLPPGMLGYVIASKGSQVVANPGGAVGTLCVAGAPISRGYGGGLAADESGRLCRRINRAFIPGQGQNSLIPILPGDTWSFQYWYRDMVNGATVSNFSDAVSVTFTLF